MSLYGDLEDREGTSTIPAPARRMPANRPGSAQGGPAEGENVRTEHTIRAEEDLLEVRHAVREATLRAGFGLVDQTRIVTAASELARNAYVHGGGGTVTLEIIGQNGRGGLRLSVSDQGPGIADLDQAFIDGYTTGAGLGHGLGGARRLMDEFTVQTAPGRGTTVTAVRWNGRV